MFTRARSAEICGDSAVVVHRRGRQHPCRDAEADPHGPDFSEDYRDSPGAIH